MSDENRIFHQLLRRVGNDGKYQTRVALIVYSIALIASSSFFINPYLFYQQPYQCNGVQSAHCTQHVCSLPLAQRQQYLTSPQINSLGNNHPSYFCGGIGTVLFMEEGILVGASVGILIAIFFSDTIGRRKLMLTLLVIALVGIALTVLVPSPWIKFIGLVLWGSGSQVTFAVSLTILIDSVADECAPMVYTKFSCGLAIGGILNVLLFYFVKNWIYILVFYYALIYAIILIAFFFLVESPPIEIVSHNKDPRESYNAFMRIARVNKKQDHGITEEEIKNIHQEYRQNLEDKGHGQRFTCIDLCRYASLRSDFIKMCLGICISVLLQFGPILLQQALLPNIFISGAVNGLTIIACLPFLGYVNEKVSRRKGNMFFCFMCAIFLLAQFIYNPSGCVTCLNGGKYILMLIFFIFQRFFANMFDNFFFTAFNETFPQQIRGTASGAACGIGRLSTLLIPYLPRILTKVSLSLNLFFAILALIGALICFLMRQTLGVPPLEQIQELKMDQKEPLRDGQKLHQT